MGPGKATRKKAKGSAIEAKTVTRGALVIYEDLGSNGSSPGHGAAEARAEKKLLSAEKKETTEKSSRQARGETAPASTSAADPKDPPLDQSDVQAGPPAS